MNILFIQAASNEAIAQERVLVEALKTALGEQISIIHPPMPDADHPQYKLWETAIRAELAKLSGRVILIGHSLGGSVLLKLFSKDLIPEKVSGMIFLGVPFWGNQSWDVSEFVIDKDAARNLSRLENIHFLHSIDDEIVPFAHLESYRNLMPGARYTVLSEVDHSYHGAISEIILGVKDLV